MKKWTIIVEITENFEETGFGIDRNGIEDWMRHMLIEHIGSATFQIKEIVEASYKESQ